MRFWNADKYYDHVEEREAMSAGAARRYVLSLLAFFSVIAAVLGAYWVWQDYGQGQSWSWDSWRAHVEFRWDEFKKGNITLN